jgi:hypothetical protein
MSNSCRVIHFRGSEASENLLFQFQHNFWTVAFAHLNFLRACFQFSCVDEMTVRYNGSIVELKQRMRLSFNGFEVTVDKLPVKLGHVLVKRASGDLLQGMKVANISLHVN